MAALSTLRVRWSYRYRSLGSDFGCSPIYLGGINHRQSSHVEDAADGRRLGEDVCRLGGKIGPTVTPPAAATRSRL